MSDDADWLDGDLTFDEWLAAWRAAWRLGAKPPTIVLDYNGLPDLRWQVYLSDESTIVHKGRKVRAGAAPSTRRRLTDDEAHAFLDAATSFVRGVAADAAIDLKLSSERHAIMTRLGISVTQELWEQYEQHRKEQDP